MAQSSGVGGANDKRARGLSAPPPATGSIIKRLLLGAVVFVPIAAAAASLTAYVWTARIFPDATPQQLAELRLNVASSAGGAAVAVLAAFAYVAAAWRRRVARPAEMLIAVAQAVANGDLTRDVVVPAGAGELTRLGEVTQAMIAELRRLTTAISDSAATTATMAGETTAGADQMSATASEIAATSNVLSQQATDMAQTLQEVHADAARLVAIAGQLLAGAREGVERNAHLRALAESNGARLGASASALATLAGEVASSAAAVEGVATASEEIRAFVALVQKMARQSKLLALNAAMEAARAGEQGQGFAVVASEVRRLAANSGDAAERTVAVVNEVLARVAESRASSAQTVQTVQTVLDASREGARTFGEVSEALAVAEQWTASIAAAATRSNALIAEMTRQLDTLAHGTESFAAAMQEVAASSEEQSASTQEIATTAAALTTHAGRLSALAAAFSVSGTPAAAGAKGGETESSRYSAPSATQPMRPSGVRTAA